MTKQTLSAKCWVWQGGIRVPMIVRGPGIRAGSVFNGNVVNYASGQKTQTSTKRCKKATSKRLTGIHL
ncbi:hypothetical protein N9B17_07300, partial [Rhodopirellula sp.]|nr:hypothetical protein [Rhodopirellula sp.]